MKFYLTLCLMIAATSAHIVPELKPRLVDLPLEEGTPELEGRITNGLVATHGQFPYQGGLIIKLPEGNAWCGCSIISKLWILTAAHCADGVKSATLIVGAQNITDTKEKHQRRIEIKQAQIIVHEEWDPKLLLNDIALIELETELEFNEYVQSIALPKRSAANETYEGLFAWASGWGKDSDNAKSVSPVLRYIVVPIMNTERCNRYYFGMVTGKMTCIITKGGTSTCNGDSGGPLVVEDGGRSENKTLIGATSFGISFGCQKGWPAVFTRIGAHLDWIAKKTGIVYN